MRKLIITAALLLLCCILAGCGKSAAATETSGTTTAQESVLDDVNKTLDNVSVALSQLDEVSDSDVSIPSP